jgi:POT family proton-dependent oligopeptide transporter
MIVYVRRLSWLGKVGEAPPAGKARPWKGLLWVALGSAALLGLLVRADRFPALLVTLYSLPLIGIAYFGLFRKDEEGRRMGAILVFFVAAILFWSVFEQAGSTLALFAEELTDNEVMGHAFPSSWFQSVNALFVMMLAPIFAWLWVRMGKGQPSVPAKFALGLLFLGLSFALMVPAATATAAGKVSPLWLLGVYLLQTIGEMCLSPVGLSAMSRLAPSHLAGLVMGVWFLATSLGNKLAGTLSAAFNAKDPGALSDFFLNQALVVGAMTIALFALVPWVRRLMGTRR